MNHQMTSNKHYLIQAIYDWIVDNELTPYILVEASDSTMQIPWEYVKENKIVLNISPRACGGLFIHWDRIVFTAKFSGKPFQISIEPRYVLAIYANENGRGMEFEIEDAPAPPPKSNQKKKSEKRPSLTLVSNRNHE